MSTELFEAIEDLDAERVTALLKAGADVEAHDEETGMPLLIAAAIARRWALDEDTELEGTPILDALLAAGANPQEEWAGASGHTALVEAAYGHDSAAVARLVEAGADPDKVVLWSAGENTNVTGTTPRLLATKTEDGCGLKVDPPPLEGRWFMVLMDYTEHHEPNTPWNPDEPYAKPYLEFNKDGTYTGVQFEWSEEYGTWSGDTSGLSLNNEDTEEVTTAESAYGGLALMRYLSDEQTGYRGSATLIYMPESYLTGLPEQGALVEPEW